MENVMTRKKTNDVAERGSRFSARRKTGAVLRLPRGEELDTTSRELEVRAATEAARRCKKRDHMAVLMR
jgi:hypothetical protein